MTRFILKRINPFHVTSDRGRMVRISSEAHRVLAEMAMESRQTMTAVVSQALIYAASQVEYEDEKEAI